MKLLILSCSLKPASRSRIMARELHKYLKTKSESDEGLEVDLLDLQDLPLPICDAGKAYGHENVSVLNEKAEWADAYIMATPIYNFDANAAAKNVIELSGRNWENKVAGFVCAAGGGMSYMSIMSLCASLMLDFRVTIVPRFVYATGESFNGPELADKDVEERLRELGDQVIFTATRLKAG